MTKYILTHVQNLENGDTIVENFVFDESKESVKSRMHMMMGSDVIAPNMISCHVHIYDKMLVKIDGCDWMRDDFPIVEEVGE